MTDIEGTIKAISKYGGILFAEHNGWCNGHSDDMKDRVLQQKDYLIGKLVHVTLNEKGQYAVLEVLDVADQPIDDERVDRSSSSLSYEKRATQAAENVVRNERRFQGPTIGMCVNNAAQYVLKFASDGGKPLPEEVWADTVTRYALALLEDLEKRGLS